MTDTLAEIERLVRAAAPGLHGDDVRAIAADIVRLLPGVRPGVAVDRYFGPDALSDGRQGLHRDTAQ